MQCVMNETRECNLDIEKITNGATTTIDAINLIADVIEGNRGWTGCEDCDKCHKLSIADAIDVLQAIRTKFELVPVKRGDNNGS